MTTMTRDRYVLAGDADNKTQLTQAAFEDEVEEQWFSPEVDKKKLKALMRREDGPALRHFGIWLALLIGSGVGVVLTWGSFWVVPFLLVYGVMYAMSDHHAHELSHGTPFKTRWLNEVLYHLNSFMTLHEAYYWRWSHTRHHTDTLLVGRDPEIAVMAPPDIKKIFLDFFFLQSGWTLLKTIFRNATGKVAGDGAHFIPEGERAKVVRLSRLYVLIFVAIIAACVVFQTILPAVLLVTPRFWGGFVAQTFNITQHAGLRENIRDHRQNTRTFHANPVYRFLYMNMNYHIEHHMFPMVPFHRLPELHRLIEDQCPPAYPSVWATYRDFVPALKKQLEDPSYHIVRPLPERAAVAAE